MRLGGSVPKAYTGAQIWAADAIQLGYFACTCPLPGNCGHDEISALADAAEKANIVIAEVGVWRNTLSPNEVERLDNIKYAKEQLALADELGARCCVNISGARGEVWDGWYYENYSPDTYAMVVDTTREIIDAVKPKRTFFTLEPMPWMVPDSPDGYLKLIKDIDRKSFAVHMDHINMINSVDHFINADNFIEEAFTKLAPYIKSVHFKDVNMDRLEMPVTLRECPPGHGMIDNRRVMKVIDRVLPKDTPVLLEHMSTMEEYAEAFAHVSSIAKEIGISIRGL